MLRWTAFLFAAFLSSANAATVSQIIQMQPPGWVVQGAVADNDFAHARYWSRSGYGVIALSGTRASTKYCQRLDGVFIQAANNIPCIAQGFLLEEARTNDALWARDMTNAAWVEAGGGITVVKNAVGIDGAANSASTLTAAGVGATCAANVCTSLQSITLASSADTYSVWLKRVTGSGTVSVTINNLTGTTACTVTSTTAFTQCQVTATLANPTIGIVMGTVGDVIVADFNQLEPGGFATSPILTTSVAATRAADLFPIGGFTLISLLAPNRTMVAKSNAPPITSIRGILIQIGDTVNEANPPQMDIDYSSTKIRVYTEGGGSDYQNVNVATYTANSINTTCFGTNSNTGGTAVTAANGGAPASGSWTGTFAGINEVILGNQAGSSFLDNYVLRVAVFPMQLAPGYCQNVTSNSGGL
jgi:hypothetical protein